MEYFKTDEQLQFETIMKEFLLKRKAQERIEKYIDSRPEWQEYDKKVEDMTKKVSKEFHEKFIQERVKKSIPIRALAVNNAPGRSLLMKDESSLRQSKLLPIHTSFSAETYIYDNKVAILDYKKDILGIIIESHSISSTQRAIFEMTWSSVK